MNNNYTGGQNCGHTSTFCTCRQYLNQMADVYLFIVILCIIYSLLVGVSFVYRCQQVFCVLLIAFWSFYRAYSSTYW